MKVAAKLLLVSLIPQLFLMLGIVISGYTIHHNQQEIKSYINDVSRRHILITNIYRQIGYGGGIHAFKNYVLRKDIKFRDIATEKFGSGKKLISTYLELPVLTNNEKQELEAIHNTIDQYLGMIQQVDRLISEKKTTEEIDELVKVDDTFAVSAIDDLQSEFAAKRLSAINNMEKTNVFTLIGSVGSLGIIFLFTFLFSRMMSLKIRRSLVDLSSVTGKIAAGEYRTNLSEEAHQAGEEFERLSQQFRKMALTLERNEIAQKNLETELRRSNASLEDKNKELEQMTYIVSHDLKSPIVTCSGFLEFLKEDLDAKNFHSAQKSIQHIESALNKMNNINGDLLRLSQVGHLESNVTEVRISDIIKRISGEFIASHQHIKFDINIPDISATFKADESQIEQIVENLLSNAVKYGQNANDTRIEVLCEETGKEVRLCIRDNGPGIDQKFHEQIFRAFKRLNKDEEGTGIGLSIVARVAGLYGGKAWVESEIGRGSAFWVSFPKS